MSVLSDDSWTSVAEDAFRTSALEALTPPRDTHFLICTYTNNDILAHIPKGDPGEGIYSWRLCGVTGKLTSGGPPSAITPNPAFLLKHPSKPVVYASTECIHAEGCGEVVTLQLEVKGPGFVSTAAAAPAGHEGATGGVQLKELGRVSAGGRSTCYLNLHGDHMAVVNYWDSIVSLLSISPLDGVAGSCVDRHMQPGAEYVFEANPDRVEHWTHRQRWPHTHCFVTEPYSSSKRQTGPECELPVHLVPDLGQDTIWAYRIDATATQGGGRLVLLGGAKLEEKQGPRHLVFHPEHKTCYVINELKSTVSTLRFRPEKLPTTHQAAAAPGGQVPVVSADPVHAEKPGAFLVHAETLRTLPADFESNDHHKSHASEIRLHPSGKFLLIANRGHDSICVFAVKSAAAQGEDEEGLLELAHITPSGGECPRNFNFDASGRFVVVGNQNSNNLTVFSFDLGTGAMQVVDTKHQPSPNFVYSLPHDEPEGRDLEASLGSEEGA